MTRAPDGPMESAILDLLARRRDGATICPSDAAKAVAGPDEADWRPQMDAARDAARRLVADGAVEVTQRGEVVDLDSAKGPIRIRLAQRAEPPDGTA
ncbi:DUF3253 domain-containing protein [Agrococcus sp. Marseille-Q4369]|uniref:DUF3253 domain-containing protein n=1 Tax=Agrococcus sp. Marseille-Q4369 TaxID=2810513 RepID=UPI001B8B2EC0|nr:DUF3253 domain-containing protein [Agrococcus sp. Marseille-Q4369]QUW19028.1 DUF3253 domain-containing protein [Agrococcus sp. Marseille-Q4369]